MLQDAARDMHYVASFSIRKLRTNAHNLFYRRLAHSMFSDVFISKVHTRGNKYAHVFVTDFRRQKLPYEKPK